MISFDQLLEKRIGFGFYQYLSLFIVGLIDFIDGLETVYTSILPTILKVEWNLNQQQIEVLGSSYYLGILFGTIVCGILSDQLGRKLTLLIGAFLQMSIIILVAYVQDYQQMVIARFILGLVFGFILPISSIYISEISIPIFRGRSVITLQMFYLMGKFYLLFLAYFFFLKNLQEGDWRGLALCNAIPGLLTFLLGIIFIKESPRFLLATANNDKQIDEAISILDYIGKLNYNKDKHTSSSTDPLGQDLNQYQPISAEEKYQLISWKNNTFKINCQNDGYNFFYLTADLFKGERLKITWRLWIMVPILLFMLSGSLFILPFMLQAQKAGIVEFAITFLGEIPAVIIVFFTIDTLILGRITSLNIVTVATIIVSIIIYYTRENFLILGVTIFKMMIRLYYLIYYPLATECYSTIYRAVGMSLVQAVGRIASTISPFILYKLFLIDTFLPFLIFAILLTFSLLVAQITFPIDLTQQPLDIVQECKQEQIIKNLENQNMPIESQGIATNIENSQNQQQLYQYQPLQQNDDNEQVQKQQNEQQQKYNNQEK